MKQLLQYDIIKKSSHAGLLCNQTAWHVSQKNYSFHALIQKAVLDYFDNKNSWKEVKAKLQDEESAWIKEASPFLIYKSSLQQLKIK